MESKAAIIGGSGFSFPIDNPQEIRVSTPYGPPSANPVVGKIGTREIVFLPRHGLGHQYPPHKIPYQANIYALKELGVSQIITCTAVGSIQRKIIPGSFVILDQFVNWTKNRPDTFFNGPVTTHISTAFPYCTRLGKLAKKYAGSLGIRAHTKGTVVVVEGPRFSTAAESLFFTRMGWDVINMTQYPEIALAREMGMCYMALGLVTDYDAGVITKNDIKPVSTSEVLAVFRENNQKAAQLMLEIVKHLLENAQI